jgi:hypothetical protein
MEIRNSPRVHQDASRCNDFRIFGFLIWVFSFLVVAGCGAPGEPVPPSPPIPVAVSDLIAQQVGDAVLLTFTVPSKSTLGERLEQLPTVEVLRGSPLPDGRPNPKSFRVVDTIPGSLLNGYVQEGKVEFPDPIPAYESQGHPGEAMFYLVRTRVSERKTSADSNAISVNVYPVPERIETLNPKVTEKSIQMSWTAPSRTSGGEALSGIQEFHVYRGELDPASAAAAERDLRTAVWKLPLLKIATTNVSEYEDTGFDFGKTYAYIVRSVVNAGGTALESADSRPAILTPKDIFPPAAPLDLVAAVLTGGTPGTLVVDLSWSINLETDVAGYRVYRSEGQDTRGELLTPDLLPTPAYRDSSVVKGRSYWYFVTAVDKAGNESLPSAAVPAELP